MASIARPQILAYTLALAAGGSTTLGPPGASTSWEVHGIWRTGDCTIQVEFDPDDDSAWESTIDYDSYTGSGVHMGPKFEMSELTRMKVTNDEASATIDVYLIGIPIT